MIKGAQPAARNVISS